MNDFLPINKKEMLERGWQDVDFVFVTGDSYVDHPSFGVAILTRLLEKEGYRVAVLSQPNWKNDGDFTQFGRPRLAFMVTSGNIDSMVAHYTAAKRLRHDDAYTAGGIAGKRPDRAVIVYSNIIKRIYPDCPVIIGGLEASLRRFAHYDYWDDGIRPSILIDSKADLLTYGMGEKQTVHRDQQSQTSTVRANVTTGKPNHWQNVHKTQRSPPYRYPLSAYPRNLWLPVSTAPSDAQNSTA